MIHVSPHPTELFGMRASSDGLIVFLDQFAIKELAKGDPERRKRFITTLDRGVEVMFSVSNAAELTGPQLRSFEEMRSFLDEIGPHWFPVEFDPILCIRRERASQDPATCCFSEGLIKAFTATHIRHLQIKPEDLPAALPPDFFRLGFFMDRLAPLRQEIITDKDRLDRALKEQIMEHRAAYKKDDAWLDAHFPEKLFTNDRRAEFVYTNLVRQLILDKGRALTRNGGIDFGQAVVSSAYASVATLDTHWKRRVEALPQPNKLAKVYCSPYLDQMVRDIERQLDSVALQRGRALFSAN
jgi:hypothetical protein